jgi:hypothetical protein
MEQPTIPPPTITILADLGSSVGLTRACPRRWRRRIETLKIIRSVGRIVEVDPAGLFGDHAPERLAQERRRRHRPHATTQIAVNRALEIKLQHVFGRLERRSAVRGEAPDIEQRRVEAGIFPVDQPQPLAVVEQIAGEHVIVAEDNVDRSDRLFQALHHLREGRQV